MTSRSDSCTTAAARCIAAYDAERASVYLIRPDGYLAFRADWADRHVLLEFLET